MTKPAKLFVAGALAFASGIANAAAAPSTASPHPWRTYVNARYRYAICYPSDLLKPRAEAPNSDGRTFHGREGAELAVFGRNNVEGQSLTSAASADAREMARPGGQVTYRTVKADWTVYSGRAGNTVFYSKTLKRGDQLLIFQLRYPLAVASEYGPVATQLSRCFTQTR